LEHLKNEKTSPQYQLQKYYPQLFISLKKRQFDVMKECVFENLERGVKLGIYRDGMNLDFITRIYFNGIIGIKDVETFPIKTFNPENLLENYLEYHIRAIATEKGLQTMEKLLLKNEK
jgi:hypothetical protein